jgi:ABC-2 type transport system permease protein
MRDALTSGDVQRAQGAQQALNTSISQLALSTGAAAALLSEVQSNGSSNQVNNQDLLALLNDLQKNSTSTNPIPQDQAGVTSEIAKLDKADSDLNQMEQQLADFQNISPEVLVRPFNVDTRSITSIDVSTIDFFTPAVIVLLLQHIAVTIAALSIVRERRSGAMELFRVSPVSSLETLLGKYISYLVFGLLIGAILTALIYFGLHVPMLGNWWIFALVGLALLFASLGLGFVISLIAETESQAVQLAMISLLLSVFFSGFMLDLRYFYIPVRVLSYAIPATYGINLLQNIMLRGSPLTPIYFGGLVLYGLVFFLLSWVLLRRQMKTR